MLMRTDPFREIDRLAEQFFGMPGRPAVMHMDAERAGDWFYVDFDLPGRTTSSVSRRRRKAGCRPSMPDTWPTL